MEEREIDRSAWGPGPWDDEPDRVEWRSQGFPCLMVRSPMGSWCGYVGVSWTHPWFHRHYDSVYGHTAHGGLTYAASCSDNPFVCHVPAPGEPKRIWWVGFDCAHLGDLVPGVRGTLREIARKASETGDTERFPRFSASLKRHFEPVMVAKPGEDLDWNLMRETYKSIPWVRGEVEALATQARAVVCWAGWRAQIAYSLKVFPQTMRYRWWRFRRGAEYVFRMLLVQTVQLWARTRARHG